MITSLSGLENSIRVKAGVNRERQIAEALRIQAGLPIEDASGYEDKERKVDRWLVYPGQKPIALQIKFRETGEDLLFEVYDKFFGWDDPKNKIGRDMIGDAKEYAVLMKDKKTVVMVPTDKAKQVIRLMLDGARQRWTVESPSGPTFRYHAHGFRIELKVQHDNRDGRPKMVAYIPAGFFVAEEQAKTYQIKLPNQWK
jgi:hypothetical protein